ncbi:unnamed protein product [Cunninghamella blakesleeana]
MTTNTSDQPTIILSPPPQTTNYKSTAKHHYHQHAGDLPTISIPSPPQSQEDLLQEKKSLSHKLSNLSLKRPVLSKPVSPSSSSALGVVALSSSLAATVVMGTSSDIPHHNENNNNMNPFNPSIISTNDDSSILTPITPTSSYPSPQSSQLHPDSAYTTNYGTDSPLSSRTNSSSIISLDSPLLTEMKRILSGNGLFSRQKSWGGVDQQKHSHKNSHQLPSPQLSSSSLLQPSLSSSTSTSATTISNGPKDLNERYGDKSFRKGKIIGQGATAIIQLLEMEECPSWIPIEKTCLKNKKKKNNKKKKRVVAIKAFRKQDKSESLKDYQKRMISEFCISKAIRHPHIVEMFDLVKDHKDRWCAVMEYCSGGMFFLCSHILI